METYKDNVITLTFKVFGDPGHRQRASFSQSREFTTQDGAQIKVENADITGNNEYSLVTISAENERDILAELMAQVDDGIFENDSVGEIVEVLSGRKVAIIDGKWALV